MDVWISSKAKEIPISKTSIGLLGIGLYIPFPPRADIAGSTLSALYQ